MDHGRSVCRSVTSAISRKGPNFFAPCKLESKYFCTCIRTPTPAGTVTRRDASSSTSENRIIVWNTPSMKSVRTERPLRLLFRRQKFTSDLNAKNCGSVGEKTKQSKAKAKQSKAKQSKPEQSKSKAKQSKAKQKQSEAKQSNAEQRKAKQNKTKQSNAKQSKTIKSRAKNRRGHARHAQQELVRKEVGSKQCRNRHVSHSWSVGAQDGHPRRTKPVTTQR